MTLQVEGVFLEIKNHCLKVWNMADTASHIWMFLFELHLKAKFNAVGFLVRYKVSVCHVIRLFLLTCYFVLLQEYI